MRLRVPRNISLVGADPDRDYALRHYGITGITVTIAYFQFSMTHMRVACAPPVRRSLLLAPLLRQVIIGDRAPRRAFEIVELAVLHRP